jgi:hypothetical protein
MIVYAINAARFAVKRFQFVSSQYCEYYLLLNSMWNLFTVCDKCSFHLMFSVARIAPPLRARESATHDRYEICFWLVLVYCWNSRCSSFSLCSYSSLWFTKKLIFFWRHQTRIWNEANEAMRGNKKLYSKQLNKSFLCINSLSQFL